VRKKIRAKETMQAKYVNPFTDFGFKKIFGEEASKPLLIDFLNALLPSSNQIKDLSFKNNEQLGLKEPDRKAIYDIYCENEMGEKFIVELQKSKQNYFINKPNFYDTFPILEYAEKIELHNNLKAVYCVGILDFTFDDYETEPEKSEVVHTIKLKNNYGKTFYDKLTFIYLEMPNFKRGEQQLETRLDKWLYFIKHLEDFQSIPSIIADDVFKQAFEKAELAKFGSAEMASYEYSLKVFRDNKAVFDYAMETAAEEAKLEGKMEGKIEGKIEGKMEGKMEGRFEAKLETAKLAKQMNLNLEDIIKLSGLSKEEIEDL
jgi:predicted transposase/invertase (TIGR01784 family)